MPWSVPRVTTTGPRQFLQVIMLFGEKVGSGWWHRSVQQGTRSPCKFGQHIVRAAG